jgi:putative tributyrin esterase
MALLTCDFFSDALELGTSMTVVLPQPTEAQVGIQATADTGSRPPVLYLLHGLSDDHSAWLRNTSVERYAAAAGLAVVMPAVARSFYADERHGLRYWTFLSEELPEIVHRFFQVSRRREDSFVAGLSMGGYGALKLALTHPDRFAAAASLSGAVDVRGLSRLPERGPLFERVFGGIPGPEADLFALLRGVPAAELPALFVACGAEDQLYPANLAFTAAAEDAGASLTTWFGHGEHEWGLWDRLLAQVIDWLPRQVGD